MKWIGQNIWSFISRFRSDVYLEDISTGTIASGSHLGLDSNNKIVKAADGGGDLTSIVAGTGLSGTSLTGPIPTLNVNESQTQITSVGDIGTGRWEASVIESAYLDADTAHLTTDQTFTGGKTFENDQTYFTSANANDPLVIIKNTADDATSGRLRFLNQRGADGQDNDETGIIEFFGYDDGSPSGERYSRIIGTIDDATAGQESGKLTLQVASHDGGDEDGLVLTGGSVDAEVDVVVGNGTASTTTITGTLTMGSTAAMTNSGLVSVVNQSNITGLGTISSGVWQGTTIKTAYIGDDQVTEDKLANTLLAEIDANTAKNSAPNIFGEYIKLLISDFATNKDGGNTKHGIGFDETVTDGNGDAYDQAYGIKVPNNATELYAFVSIPRGKTATHVEVFDRGDNLAFEVFEVQINAATMVSKGTGNCNTINNIDDVVATETNQLAIKVTTVSVNNRVWGGRVTIA